MHPMEKQALITIRKSGKLFLCLILRQKKIVMHSWEETQQNEKSSTSRKVSVEIAEHHVNI